MIQPTRIPAQTDWIATSKTLVLEVAFIGSMCSILAFHNYDANVVNLAWALGGTLGLLRIADIGANIANVRAYLQAPGARQTGVVPQAVNTPLLQTNGVSKDASP